MDTHLLTCLMSPLNLYMEDCDFLKEGATIFAEGTKLEDTRASAPRPQWTPGIPNIGNQN